MVRSDFNKLELAGFSRVAITPEAGVNAVAQHSEIVEKINNL